MVILPALSTSTRAIPTPAAVTPLTARVRSRCRKLAGRRLIADRPSCRPLARARVGAREGLRGATVSFAPPSSSGGDRGPPHHHGRMRQAARRPLLLGCRSVGNTVPLRGDCQIGQGYCCLYCPYRPFSWISGG